jgi:hypothetical protein
VDPSGDGGVGSGIGIGQCLFNQFGFGDKSIEIRENRVVLRVLVNLRLVDGGDIDCYISHDIGFGFASGWGLGSEFTLGHIRSEKCEVIDKGIPLLLDSGGGGLLHRYTGRHRWERRKWPHFVMDGGCGRHRGERH